MDLAPLLAKHGGWRHRADFLDQGWTPGRLLVARRRERIPLVRRRWLILPDAPLDVREAARVGGVVTGISALERYSLWVPPAARRDRAVHIAVRPDASIVRREGIRYDRSKPVIGRSPRALVDDLPNVLANVARRLRPIDAFAVWESAIARKHLTADEVGRLRWSTEAARSLAKDVSALSDSGVESTFVANCRRAGIRVVQQVRIAGRPVDALIGRHLVVQIDGYAYHSDAAQRRADIAHDRQLIAMGYTVLRYTYQDVMYDWPRVEREIRAAIAGGRAD